jgi:amidase
MSMTDQDETVWADAVEQAGAIRTGEARAVDLVRAYLDRIERFDPLLRAYVAVDEERALADARRADAAVHEQRPDALPPFLGVAISMKDVLDVAGLPTTQSSKALADHVATDDAPLVCRLREAGFIVLGKTNVPEFCTSMTSSDLNGICRNPWDTDLTPAGSSGGAAAALSAGLCAVAHGTDGAGSVRVPASFCGLVGTKPSRGLVAFGPELGNPYYATSVDGILSHSVRDAAALLDVFAGVHDVNPPWPGWPTRTWADASLDEPGSLRVAVTTSFPVGEIVDECAGAALTVAKELESLGHHVEHAAPQWDVILAVAAGPMNVPGPAAQVELDQLELVEPRNRPMIERGATLTVLEHARWVEQTRAAALEFLTFWDDFDVLVTPTAGILPPSVDWAPWDQTPEAHLVTFMTFANFAQPFNLSGQPGISVPAVWSERGLPLGVQLVGRRFGEATLLQVARQLEAAMPWADRRPPGVD